QSIAVTEQYVYLCENMLREGQRIRILDVSDPTRPSPVGLVPLPQYACISPEGLAVTQEILLAMDSRYGGWAFDVSDPANPALISACEWHAQSVVAQADRFFLA